MPRRIVYARRLGTGLGDRMLVLIGATAMATFNERDAVLHYHWINTAHRSYDVAALMATMHLPTSLLISPTPVYTSHIWRRGVWGVGALPAANGYDCVPELIPQTFFKQNHVDTKVFLKHYASVARQFVAKVASKSHIVLHVRGTDKGYGFKHCVRHARHALRHSVIRVVTDDVAYAQRLFPTSTVRKQSELADLQTLLGASCIIMHSPGGWSAFSAMAGFFNNIPVLTTAVDTWQLQVFRNAGATLPGWYDCNSIADFVQKCNLTV